MSIARKVGVWFGVFLFTTFLALGLMAFSLAQLTQYDVIEPAFSKMVVSKMNMSAADMQNQYKGVQMRCEEPGTTEIPLQQGVSLKCSDAAATDAEGLPAVMAKTFFDSIYYKKYPCSFITCLRTLPKTESSGMVFTEKAHLFFSDVWAYLFLAAAAAAALLMYAAEKGSSRLKSVGFSFLITGTPYFLFGMIGNLVPKDVAAQAAPLIDIMIKTLADKFLIVFIAGVLLVASGFAMGYAETRAERSSAGHSRNLISASEKAGKNSASSH